MAAKGAQEVNREVQGGSLSDSSGVVVAGEADPELLRNGSLSEAEFVERTVLRATAHLEGQLPAARLQEMRELLAYQVHGDPVLAELLAQVKSAD